MIKNTTVHVTLKDLYFGVICVFPIVTMLTDEGVLNKLLFGILLGLHICIALSSPMRKYTFLGLLVLGVNYVFAIYSTKVPLNTINLLFYLLFYFLYTYYMCDNNETAIDWFTRHSVFVEFVVALWTVLVGISIFVPSCYYLKEGGSLYFGSFCVSIFRLGPSAVFIQVMAIALSVLDGKKGALLYMIIPMYCFLMGSSRTYLVVGLCLFAIAWYFTCKKRAVFWCTIIPMAVLVLMIVAVSSMGDKIAYTLDDSQYGDFWFRITSGRSMIWEVIIMFWKEKSVFNKLLGSGLEFTVQVASVWAHNDFLEILCSFGIIGLVQYLYSVKRLYKYSYKKVRIPFFIKACAFMVWFFNAFFNMHYVYFCAMLSYPIVLSVIRVYFEKNPMKEKWKPDMALEQIGQNAV